jgi:hypothetical protein
MGRIELKDSIGALRQDLIDAILSGEGEHLLFEVGEIQLEFQFEIEQTTEGKGGIKFWVVEIGEGETNKDKTTHKVIIPLKPRRREGGPILTGSSGTAPG